MIKKDAYGYLYDGERFSSYQEVQCYQYLNVLGINRQYINHEYRVGNYNYDFFPLKKIFWEHHPIGPKYGEDMYEYSKRRRLILNDNGYNEVPLIVTDSMFVDLWEVWDLMNNYGIDFRNGTLSNSASILCIHDYSKDYCIVDDEIFSPISQ